MIAGSSKQLVSGLPRWKARANHKYFFLDGWPPVKNPTLGRQKRGSFWAPKSVRPGRYRTRLNGIPSTTIVQASGFIRARRRIAIRVIMGSKG
jgi:hypothetical protein